MKGTINAWLHLFARYEYRKDLMIEKISPLHDEDEGEANWVVSYKGFIVGSELVHPLVIANNIEILKEKGYVK